MSERCLQRFFVPLLGALAATLAGCVSRGYPTHGGGKRFFHEQALVTNAIDAAVAQVPFDRVKEVVDASDAKNDGSIAVQVFSVAHSGGGVQTGATGPLAGIFGASPVLGGAQQGGGGNTVALGSAGAAAGGGNYFAFGFESADDVRYLMGRVTERLGSVGLRVVSPTADVGKPMLCVLVRELGIEQSGFNAFIYQEKKLAARASVELFVVARRADGDPGVNVESVPIGRGAATWRFREDFFLGFGPLTGGEPEPDPIDQGGQP